MFGKPCNHATMQPCNHATMQPCNHATKCLLIAFLLLFFSFTSILAQSSECSTEDTDDDTRRALPWYGNDDFLPSYLAELEARGSLNVTIPVQFIVVLTDDETLEGAMPNNFGFLMNTINEGYQRNGMFVNFQMLCPKIARSVNTATNQAEDFFINNFLRTNGAINVIIKTSPSRYFSPLGGGYIAIPRDRDNNTGNAITFIHEVGHYFGLDHTHSGFLNGSANPPIFPCNREDVRRDDYIYLPTNLCNVLFFKRRYCNIKGDGFCDTPADPAPSTGITTDNFGATFTPQRSNYMGYWTLTQRSLFSASQRGAIAWNLAQKIVLGKINPSLVPFSPFWGGLQQDKYENDNTWDLAEEIKVGDIQDRTLLSGEDCDADKIDVIYFDLRNGKTDIIGNYIFEAIVQDGQENFIEEVKVFGTDEDDHAKSQSGAVPLPGVIFSENKLIATIPCNKLNPEHQYLVFEVHKKEELSGNYKAKMSKDINLKIIPDNQSYCVGKNDFELQGVPPTATYTWTGQGMTLSNTANEPTSILSYDEGTQNILIALIDYQGCREIITKNLTGKIVDFAPVPTIFSPAITVAAKDCYNYGGKITIKVAGAVSVSINAISVQGQPKCSISKSPYGDWYELSGSFVPLQGQTYSTVTFAGEVTATNACGDISILTFTGTVSKPICGKGNDDDVSVAPNPADERVAITIIPIDQSGGSPGTTQRRITIVNMQGEVKYDQITSDTILELPTNDYSEGLYIVKVTRQNDEQSISTSSFLALYMTIF
jgi:Secretion system C-terminal sorting domain